MADLQQKLQLAEVEEQKREKAHEKLVEEQKKVEIEKKKARDREMQRKAVEEAERQKEIARKDSELKKKLVEAARSSNQGSHDHQARRLELQGRVRVCRWTVLRRPPRSKGSQWRLHSFRMVKL